MSRDIYNPLLLLVIVILLACRISHTGDAGTLEMWVLVLCSTGFVLDGALSLARSMTQRPALMQVVWAVVFLLIGCSTWVMATSDQGTAAEDLAEYRAMYAQFRDGADVNARNENGDTLLLLTVDCGKENLVRSLLKNESLDKAQLPEAAMRAVTARRIAELEMLLDAGVNPDSAVDGTTLLCLAASYGNVSAVSLLLERGASPTLADSTGVSPLSNAVTGDNTQVVECLRAAGACPDTADPDGRLPRSYSRSEKMDKALQ